MSILSDIFDFFINAFRGIIKFLKDNFLLIVLIVVGLYFLAPGLLTAIGGWLATAGITVGGWIATAAAAAWTWLGTLSLTEALWGLAAVWFISDPEGAIEFVTESIATVVTGLVEAVSEGLGLPGLIMGGLALYFFIGRDKDDKPADQLENGVI